MTEQTEAKQKQEDANERLRDACYRFNIPDAEAALADGAQINAREKKNFRWTPLHFVVYSESINRQSVAAEKMVRFLISKGANRKIRDVKRDDQNCLRMGVEPWHMASTSLYNEVEDVLKPRHSDPEPEANDPRSWRTPVTEDKVTQKPWMERTGTKPKQKEANVRLWDACSRLDIMGVYAAVNDGAQVNERDARSDLLMQTPLHKVVEGYGCSSNPDLFAAKQIVKFLVSKGADRKIKDIVRIRQTVVPYKLGSVPYECARTDLADAVENVLKPRRDDPEPDANRRENWNIPAMIDGIPTKGF